MSQSLRRRRSRPHRRRRQRPRAANGQVAGDAAAGPDQDTRVLIDTAAGTIAARPAGPARRAIAAGLVQTRAARRPAIAARCRPRLIRTRRRRQSHRPHRAPHDVPVRLAA